LGDRQERAFIDLNADQFILTWDKGQNESFVVRLYLDDEAFLGLPVLDLERPDSRLVDPPPFSGEHSNDPPDSDIRLDGPLLRHGRDFTYAALQEDQSYRTGPPYG
jgi:hypothetical protein